MQPNDVKRLGEAFSNVCTTSTSLVENCSDHKLQWRFMEEFDFLECQ